VLPLPRLPSCSFANSAPKIASHTTQVGHVKLDRKTAWDEVLAVNADLDSPLRCVDSAIQDKMKAEVDTALKAGDTVGGIFEVIAHNIPVGLGSHAQWTKNSTAASPKP